MHPPSSPRPTASMPRAARWLAALCLCAGLLGGCAAPAAQSGGATPAPAVDTPAAAAPGGVAAPSRACRVDADCAVKDVGSCCGAFPACVARDAVTNPAAVQAQCAREGMASVCGFREVAGCACVAGTCQDAGSGAQLR